LSGSGSDVLADGPQKSSHLTSNGGGNDGSFLANRCKPAKPTTQANLGLPGDVTNRFRNPRQALLQRRADPSLIPICPSALDQSPASAPVAGQSQTRPAHIIPSGTLRRHQAQEKPLAGGGFRNGARRRFRPRMSPPPCTNVTATM
jgi:hypothetical protein